MANDNTEIEIKVPVNKKIFESLKRKLKRTAEFQDKIHHIDTYYLPEHIDYLKPKVPHLWLSIRRRGGINILNYKHWHKDRRGKYTHCDEYETIVEKPDQLEKIFEELKVNKMVTVDKTRWRFTVGKEFEVSLDLVKSLGHFIEIESVKKYKTIDIAVENLENYANELGLDHTIEVTGGYAFQMMKKKGYV